MASHELKGFNARRGGKEPPDAKQMSEKLGILKCILISVTTPLASKYDVKTHFKLAFFFTCTPFHPLKALAVKNLWREY